MQMTNDEIIREYKGAKNPKQQIKILAELNCCSETDIQKIIESAESQEKPKRKYTRRATAVAPKKPSAEENGKTAEPKLGVPQEFINLAIMRIDDLYDKIAELKEQEGKYSAEISILNNRLRECAGMTINR